MSVETLRIYVIVVGLLVTIVGGFQWRRWLYYKPENQLAWLAACTTAGVPGAVRPTTSKEIPS